MIRIILFSEIESPLVVPFDAVGWENTQLKLSRSSEFYGLFFEYSTPLQFHTDGAAYLSRAYDANGIDAVVEVKIELAREDHSTSCLDYVEVFAGRVNFAKYKQIDLTGDVCRGVNDSRKLLVEVFIDPTGLEVLLINRKNVPVPLNAEKSLDLETISELDPETITLHGKAIFFESGYVITDFFNDTDTGIGARTFYLPEMSNQYDDIGGTVTPYGRFRETAAVAVPFIYENTTTDLQSFEVDFRVICEVITELNSSPPIGADGFIGLAVGVGADADDTIFASTIQTSVITDNGVSLLQNLDALDTVAFTVLPGQKVFIYWQVPLTGFDLTTVFDFTFNFEVFEITLRELTIPSDTTSDAYLIHETSAKVLEYITNEIDVLNSSLFGRTDSAPRTYSADGCDSLLAFTNGENIRNLTGAKPPTISLEDLFRDLNAVFNIGLGVEGGEVVIERKKHFFDDTDVALIFTFIPGIDCEVAESLYYNKVRVGYSKTAKDDINTLDEFNTSQTRANTLKATSKELRLLSETIASGYAIETTRRKQFDAAPSTGSEFDNDNFFISVIRDGLGFKSEKDENFNVVDNVISPGTSYNLRLSPLRNFLRSLDWINTALYKKTGLSFFWKFQEGEGNVDLSTELSSTLCPDEVHSEEIDESQDIDASLYKQSIIVPEFVTFDAPFTLSQWLELKQDRNRYKLIRVSETDSNFIDGYLWDLDFNPAKRRARITLIRASNV